MSIIISKNLKNAVKVDRSSFALEDNLQQYIFDNPDSIPLYDIKEDIKLLILAREFPTSSGPIDAIGVDRDGEIYLVETKLYKNPDKRLVVAQVLDYGASLWKTYTDFGVFISQLESQVSKKFNKTINDRVREFFNLEDEQLNQFNENLRDNLNDGNFKFVVLMDQIHNQLKDLIIFINQNSRFNIYGVELDYYKYENFEILIPKLFGTEVKKEVGTKKASITIPTDEEYINLYQSIGLENEIKEILKFYNDIRENRISINGLKATKTPKNIILYFTFPGEKQVSFTLTLASVSTKSSVENAYLDVWCYDKKREQLIKNKLNELLPAVKLLPDFKKEYGLIARLPSNNISLKSLQEFYIHMNSAK